MQDAAWVVDVEGDKGEEHRDGVEDVRVPLVLGDVAEDAGGELDQPIDVAEDDEAEDSVEEVEEVAGIDGRIQCFHMNALPGGKAGLLLS